MLLKGPIADNIIQFDKARSNTSFDDDNALNAQVVVDEKKQQPFSKETLSKQEKINEC